MEMYPHDRAQRSMSDRHQAGLGVIRDSESQRPVPGPNGQEPWTWTTGVGRELLGFMNFSQTRGTSEGAPRGDWGPGSAWRIGPRRKQLVGSRSASLGNWILLEIQLLLSPVRLI